MLAMVASLSATEIVNLGDGYSIFGISRSYTVPAGKVATVTAMGLDGNAYIYIGGARIYKPISGTVTLSAGMDILLTAGDVAGDFAFAQLKVEDATSGTYLPQNAVVIPAEGGDYNVILECSEDLVTWTACSPGQYGSTYAKRFFRVRLEAATP